MLISMKLIINVGFESLKTLMMTTIPMPNSTNRLPHPDIAQHLYGKPGCIYLIILDLRPSVRVTFSFVR